MIKVQYQDGSVQAFEWEDEQAKHAFWHSSSHLMAEALQELYPGIQFGIGPAIENGFYYDVMPAEGQVIKESDFPAIEAKIAEIQKRKESIVRSEITKADALKAFGEKGQTYKCELISELEDGTITTYTQGNFTDLCKGPHLLSTSDIKAVKVLSCAAAYWRGDEKRPMMTRIYGISFPKRSMLDEYLALLEEAKKRDHRVRSSSCSCSRIWSAKVCLSGCRRERHFVCVWRISSRLSRSVTVTSRSSPRISAPNSCI